MDTNRMIEKVLAGVAARMECQLFNSPEKLVSAVPESSVLSEVATSDSFELSILKPDYTSNEVVQLCSQAGQVRISAVRVPSQWTSLCAFKLGGTGVKVCTVVGHPFGTLSQRVKAFEARTAVSDGAEEIDFILNSGLTASGDLNDIKQEILNIRRVCRPRIRLSAVICLEGNSRETLLWLTRNGIGLGINGIKLSFKSGYGQINTAEVKSLIDIKGEHLSIGVSGNLQDSETVSKLLNIGVNRIGVSTIPAFLVNNTSDLG